MELLEMETTAAPTSPEAVSPFAGFHEVIAGESPAGEAQASLASPFSEGLVGADGAAEDEEALVSLFAELEDEEFEEALEALVDEAAGRHLESTASWSTEAEAPALAASEVEAWMAGIAAEADRLLERLEGHFGDRAAESLMEGELEQVISELVAEPSSQWLPAGEQFIGSLVKKAGKLVKGVANVARKGLAALSKLLPIGKLFGLLRQLIRPLLARVLRVALNRLPPQLRTAAAGLARRLRGEAAEDESTPALGEAFDTQLAEAALAGHAALAEEVVAEALAEAEAEGEDAVAALDDARARLGRQLAEAAPGAAPLAEIEQFVPAVMAALPLIRLGVGVVGREKVVGFVAGQLAGLIKGHVGPAATRALSRAIADTGLRMLTLEGEAEAEGTATLGAEALVSTLEDTVRAVAELPAESLAEPLRLEAEIQEAFADSAARHLPRQWLRGDLAGHETDNEAGVWVFMPRSAGRRYRYRKYSQVVPVRISRPLAQAVLLRNGDTLERRLLDAGLRRWPVSGEVHLYETLPGTHIGHLAAFEADAAAEATAAFADEFEDLTPETAAMLVGSPRLGRRTPMAAPATRPAGRRLYRLAIRGLPPRRRRRPRFIVRLDARAPQPILRVHLRLSEREAHNLAGQLARRAHVQVVAALRRSIDGLARQSLAERIVRRSRRALGAPLPAERAAQLAAVLAEKMVTTVARQLPTVGPALADAARDPAAGVTLTFTFTFPDRAAIGSGEPAAPAFAVRPGQLRD